MKKSEMIVSFLDFLKEAEHDCADAIRREREADLEIQDIEHRFELYDDSYHDTAKLGIAARQSRRKRRIAKDEHIVTEPIVKWCHDNPGFIKKLNTLANEVRRIERQMSNRHYNERTDVISRTLHDIDKGQPEPPLPALSSETIGTKGS